MLFLKIIPHGREMLASKCAYRVCHYQLMGSYFYQPLLACSLISVIIVLNECHLSCCIVIMKLKIYACWSDFYLN